MASADEQAEIDACLEAHGYPAAPPDPVPEEWARANLECASDAGIDLPYDEPEERAAASESAHGWVRCMRDLGWDVGDPVSSDFADFLKPPPVEIDHLREEEQQSDMSACYEEAFGEPMEFVDEGEDVAEHD